MAKNTVKKTVKQRDYYAEIDKAIKSYEYIREWHEKSIHWICARIEWCWKFKHITKDQMEELCARIVEVMKYTKSYY